MNDPTMNDPWAVLGLAPGSSLDQARGARRRLAKQLHPDLHAGRGAAESAELSARMTRVNQALAAIESAEAGAPRPTSPTKANGGDGDDGDSFSIDCLPVVAFEALFVAAYGLGDILVADEPYLMDLYLLEPAPCFCRLTLVPQAGGSIVTVDVSPAAHAGEAPETGAVIDVLIAELTGLISR